MVVAAVNGIVLAIALILPIGMQNGFLLNQGAYHMRLVDALPAVVTAAICDTLLIALAVVGVSGAALHIAWLRYGLGVVGIAFLVYIGRTTWRNESPGQQGAASAWPLKRQITFAVSVSLLNPHALLDTLAVIGGSALAYTTWPDKLAFGIACASVSWIWFLSLALIGHAAGRMAVRKLSFRLINRISAIMMWASAIYLAYVLYSFA